MEEASFRRCSQAPAGAPGPGTRSAPRFQPGALTDVEPRRKAGSFQRFPSHSENYLVRLDLGSGGGAGALSGGPAHTLQFGTKPVTSTMEAASKPGSAPDAESGKEKARYVEDEPVRSPPSDTIAVAEDRDALAL